MQEYQGIIYKWVNKVNQMKYIGAHLGPESDGHIGRGRRFRADLKKYGLDNFERHILEYVADAAKLKERESYYLELVDAADNPEYYNISNRSTGFRHKKKTVQTKRPICCVCNQHPAAVNYCREGIKYFRTKCDSCIKKKKGTKKLIPRWQSSGYKKKVQCDRCAFRARLAAQLLVYHLDGILTNSNPTNLRTICLNCVEEVKRLDVPWARGDLQADH